MFCSARQIADCPTILIKYAFKKFRRFYFRHLVSEGWIDGGGVKSAKFSDVENKFAVAIYFPFKIFAEICLPIKR
jgi:hypothetical protein